MTATTATVTSQPRRSTPARSSGVTFGHLIRSEWIKFTTVRSTPWTLGMTVLAIVGISTLAAFGNRSYLDSSNGTANAHDIANLITVGPMVAQMVIVVLGALFITGEYSTGQVRSTFAAAPRRGWTIAAKFLVLAVVATVVAAISVLVSTMIVSSVLSSVGGAVDWSNGFLWQCIGGSVGAFVAVALMTLGFGFLLRSTAATVSTSLGLILVAPIMLSFIHFTWVQDINALLPSSATSALLSSGADLEQRRAASDSIVLSATQGGLVLAAWVALGIGLGWWRLRKSDV